MHVLVCGVFRSECCSQQCSSIERGSASLYFFFDLNIDKNFTSNSRRLYIPVVCYSRCSTVSVRAVRYIIHVTRLPRTHTKLSMKNVHRTGNA